MSQAKPAGPGTVTPAGKGAANPKSAGKISVMTLAIMNIVAVVSLRGLPAEAEYGLGSIFYYIFAAVVFLIPVSLVAAEMAAAWPQKGGVYRWVGEAFGTRLGFLAIWLLWIESTIWFPTVLTFAAVSLAFVGPSQTCDVAFSANKVYVLVVCLLVYWGATLINFRGFSAGAWLSKWGGLIGTAGSSPRNSTRASRPPSARLSRIRASMGSGWENSWYTSTHRHRSTAPRGSRGSIAVPSTGLMFVRPSRPAASASIRSISGWMSTA